MGVNITTIISAVFYISMFIPLLKTYTVVESVTFSFSTPVSPNTLTGCNKNCHCDEGLFHVVCDTSGRKFYSPCLAGCQL